MRYFLPLVVVIACRAEPSGAQAAERVDYVRDVEPIFERYCVGCHSGDQGEGELALDSHAGLLAGGQSGVAITPGVAGSSRLASMVAGKLEPRMPPEGEERPTPHELETVVAWIDQGAQGPTGEIPLKRKLRVPVISPAPDAQLPVTAVAFAPDGNLQAVARYGKVELRSADGTVVSTLSAELDKVNALQFSRDGSQLLVATGLVGVYGNAVIFAVDTGQLIQELVGHRDALYAARFSPDESMVATAGYDSQIILWDLATGEPVHRLKGHNGAVFDLAFSPNGNVLCSASADETVKVWSVATGERLDTLGQPESEVLAVAITPDGKHIVAGSADNRLRAWALRSTERAAINPLVATRFVDDSPLVDLELTPDGRTLAVLSQAGNLKLLRTTDWEQTATLEPLVAAGGSLAISPDGKTATVALINGEIAVRDLSAAIEPERTIQPEHAAAKSVPSVFLDLGPLSEVDEGAIRARHSDGSGANKPSQHTSDPSPSPSPADRGGGLGRGATQQVLELPRGAVVSGVISAAGEADLYGWRARAGEVWAIDADAADKSTADKSAESSPLDPVVAVLDAAGEPVLRTRLQATRSTYFTFRGKDSLQSTDFRLFNWEELRLSAYLYAGGEVTRLWMHPRGPDSGFLVYPGVGDRWTYFGATHTTHALGEPAYIVRPLAADESPTANGLPTFNVFYENDDDPMRIAGKSSRLLFTAPADGSYTVRISDVRGDGGETFAYRLAIRPAAPSFEPSVEPANGDLRRGAGREFTVRVNRYDGFDGPVTFDLPELPAGMTANVPLTVEKGQQFAVGTVWIGESVEPWDGSVAPQLIAFADVNGRRVERRVGPIGELKLGKPATIVTSLQPIDGVAAEDENWTLQVRCGETVPARVVVRRTEGANQEIAFGNETAGRNVSQGVYVDNIGLNGLRILANSNERVFYLTADPTAIPGKRSFFLTAQVDDNVTSHPITVEVLPAASERR